MYKINQRVKHLNVNCLIVATKENPYKPKMDVYNRAEIYPEKDFLIFRLERIENNICIYSGLLDVYESEIENIEW